VAIRVDDRMVLPLDSARGHSVTEALWSPDGSHIAWVARVGAERQQEVFTSRADGSDMRNVSQDASEDYHIAWSPSGEVLAFTSMRDGNAELYAADLVEDRLWRLTRHNAHDDGATFSADGRSIAFESTRRGFPSVYVMPALGGEVRLVGGGVPLEFVAWHAKTSSYLDYVRIRGGDLLRGDSSRLYLRGFDAYGDSIPVTNVEWRVIDSALVRFGGSDADSMASMRRVVGLRDGVARIVATVGRWRSDTSFVRVGASRVALLSGAFSDGLTEWRPLGVPAPEAGRTSDAGGLLLRAGREWDSGVLSRRTVPLAPHLTVEASVVAPWMSPPDVTTEVSLALVVPEDRAAIDSIAPQFLRLASITWKADAGRFAFAVGKDVFTEPVAPSHAGTRRLSMVIEPDSTVSFLLDDKRRWRSTLRLTAPRAASRVQIWISGRGTGDQVRISSVSAALAASDSVRHAP
jgi:TolB protein